MNGKTICALEGKYRMPFLNNRSIGVKDLTVMALDIGRNSYNLLLNSTIISEQYRYFRLNRRAPKRFNFHNKIDCFRIFNFPNSFSMFHFVGVTCFGAPSKSLQTADLNAAYTTSKLSCTFVNKSLFTITFKVIRC